MQVCHQKQQFCIIFPTPLHQTLVWLLLVGVWKGSSVISYSILIICRYYWEWGRTSRSFFRSVSHLLSCITASKYNKLGLLNILDQSTFFGKCTIYKNVQFYVMCVCTCNRSLYITVKYFNLLLRFFFFFFKATISLNKQPFGEVSGFSIVLLKLWKNRRRNPIQCL